MALQFVRLASNNPGPSLDYGENDANASSVYIGIGDTRKSAETWLLEQSAMGLQLYTASRSNTQHVAMLVVGRWRQGSITVKGTLSIASICICCQTISVSVSHEDECSAGWVAGHTQQQKCHVWVDFERGDVRV